MTLNIGGSRQFYDNSYFLTAANAAFNLGTSDVFLSGWLYRDSTGNHVVWAKYQDATNYWRFEITAGHKAHFIAVVGGVTQVEITGATSLSSTATWYHVCVTIDRSATAGCKIYVNGVDDTSGTSTTSVNSIDNTGGLYTGQGGASALYWQGKLQSLLLAKPTDVTTIATAAVASLYNTNSAKYYGDLTASEKTNWNVTLHYNCNEGSGTGTLQDQVSATNDGVRTHDSLNTDGGLENWTGSLLDSWDEVVIGASTLAKETTIIHGGLAASAATIDGSNNVVRIRQDIGMTTGRTYAYSVWARADSGTPTFKIGTNGSVSFTKTLSNAYQQFTGTFVSDDAQAYLITDSAAGRIVYWDDIAYTATTIPAANGQSESVMPVDGDPILSWTSDHTDASEFAQATAASRPTYNYQALHGHSVLTFDGTDDVIEFAASLDTTALGTLAVVFTTGTTAFVADQTLFASADEAAANVYFQVGIDSAGKCFVEVNDSGTVHRVTGNTVLANSTSYLIELRSDGATWDMRVNGVAQTLTVTGSNSGKWLGDLAGRDNCTLGAIMASSTVDYFEGEIAEVMLYSTRLSDVNLGTLEDYVIDRYDIAMA